MKWKRSKKAQQEAKAKAAEDRKSKQNFHGKQLGNWIFFQNFQQVLVLVLINIDGVEKIEMIPALPGNLNYRELRYLREERVASTS